MLGEEKETDEEGKRREVWRERERKRRKRNEQGSEGRGERGDRERKERCARVLRKNGGKGRHYEE